eukprot:15348502-Ditylum_brightwellii.AAC.1
MKKAFTGTEYEQDFFFYHDVLSLMASYETINWIQQEGILKHWILPEQVIISGTQYANAPTGNAPEFNALDSNCNCDIHCAVLEHVSHTAHLQNTDEWQFLVSTPKQMDSAYLCLWDPLLQSSHSWEAGVPSPKQLLEDL